jgi:hypothetical protein
MKRDAQTGGKLLTGRCRQRKVPHWFKGGFDRRDKARGDRLRRLAGNLGPDFGKVGLGGIGEAKR